MSDDIPYLLQMYYKDLFPYNLYFEWLNYGGNPKDYFSRREFSFTLGDEIYLRYQSFSTKEDLVNEIQKRNPQKIDIGAVYNINPKDHRKVTLFQPVEKELVFDIDMTDYDDVRNCCQGADICEKCWGLMTIAMRIIDRALRLDFGFVHLLWVYSGRRGVHCWVCDEGARKLSSAARTAVVEYLSIVKGGANQVKKVNLSEQIHPSIQEAVKIVEEHFPKLMLEDQDLLGIPERYKAVLNLIKEEKVKEKIDALINKNNGSKKRWELISNCCSSSEKSTNCPSEIMLQYTYPRLDVNVSKGINHLLKAPFCVHPKTGRVCVPIDPRNFTKFNPMTVPTVMELAEELHKSTDKNVVEEKNKGGYTNTSLNSSIQIFQKFVKGLEKARIHKNVEEKEKSLDY